MTFYVVLRRGEHYASGPYLLDAVGELISGLAPERLVEEVLVGIVQAQNKPCVNSVCELCVWTLCEPWCQLIPCYLQYSPTQRVKHPFSRCLIFQRAGVTRRIS